MDREMRWESISASMSVHNCRSYGTVEGGGCYKAEEGRITNLPGWEVLVTITKVAPPWRGSAIALAVRADPWGGPKPG